MMCMSDYNRGYEDEGSNVITPLLIAFVCICAGALTYVIAHDLGNLAVDGSVSLAIAVVGVCCTMMFALYNSHKNRDNFKEAVLTSGIDDIIADKVVERQKASNVIKNNLDDTKQSGLKK